VIIVRREDLALSVADAVLAVPGVAALHPGFGVEVATLFSGGKVVGVRLSGETVQIYLTAERVPLQPIADEAAKAAGRVLAAAGDPRPVEIVVADVTTDAVIRRTTARGTIGAHG